MITLTLLGALFGLAVVDSINPSALLVAGLILTKAPAERKIRAILWYVAGVYVANFAIGVALLSGLGAFLSVFQGFLDSTASYVVQSILGAAMLAWALFSKPRANKGSRYMPKVFTGKVLLLLGMAVTLAEVVTAFPYFGAIGLLERAELSLPSMIALLLAYNAIFVLPPLVLTVIYRFNRQRFDAWLQKRQANAKPSDVMQWIVGIIGFLILRDAAQFLL